MTALQSYQGKDLALAHQIATADFKKFNAMCQGQSPEALCHGFYGKPLESARLQAEQNLEEIEERLDCWFAAIKR